MNIGSRRRGRRRLWKKGWPDHASLRCQVDVTVPFHDADPTGVTWHGNYFRYYDTARTALLAKLQFGYRQMAAAGQSWPIIDTRVRYRRSIPYGSHITVSAQLVEWEFRMVIYYQIWNDEGTLVNEAYTVQVPLSIPTESLNVGTPEALRTRVREIVKK